MLYLTRKIDESIIINDTIELKVVEIRGRSVKLGFEFPSDATVLRKELYERIRSENQEAAKTQGASQAEALKKVRIKPSAGPEGSGESSEPSSPPADES